MKLVDRVVVKKAGGEDDFEFKTLSYTLSIEVDSQPFIADLNGDYLDDILYTETSATSQILVALQLPQLTVDDPPMFHTSQFDTMMRVQGENMEEGCIGHSLENKRLTVPHSAALIDFDGDCLADLFLTV